MRHAPAALYGLLCLAVSVVRFVKEYAKHVGMQLMARVHQGAAA